MVGAAAGGLKWGSARGSAGVAGIVEGEDRNVASCVIWGGVRSRTLARS